MHIYMYISIYIYIWFNPSFLGMSEFTSTYASTFSWLVLSLGSSRSTQESAESGATRASPRDVVYLSSPALRLHLMVQSEYDKNFLFWRRLRLAGLIGQPPASFSSRHSPGATCASGCLLLIISMYSHMLQWF